MRLSTIGLILILGLLTAPPAADAQQRGKVPRIGVLLPGSPTPEYERRLDAFRQGLRELGYIDTQNILREYRWADAQYEPWPTWWPSCCASRSMCWSLTVRAQAWRPSVRPVPSQLCWPMLQT